MSKTSIFVCGNYGYRTGQIDGQTVKTRVLLAGFADAPGVAAVRELDSSRLRTGPVRFLQAARAGIRDCSQTVMLPGCRGLQMFLPLFLHWKKRFHKPLQYVVVGGWLPQLLAAKPWLRRQCASLDGIYVETASMAAAMKRLGLENVRVMPNFRKFDLQARPEFRPAGRPLKLVFYSRVMREKGVEEAIAGVARLNQDPAAPVVTLDIFGPVANDYRAKFQLLMAGVPAVRYGGVLAPAEATGVLGGFDLMLFPTYYEGEGFPGAVVDAFIAGVPVIASNWKYNGEIVTPGQTGALCQPRSVEDLAARILEFVDAPARLFPMRRNCADQARAYHVDFAVQQLLADIRLRR